MNHMLSGQSSATDWNVAQNSDNYRLIRTSLLKSERKSEESLVASGRHQRPTSSIEDCAVEPGEISEPETDLDVDEIRSMYEATLSRRSTRMRAAPGQKPDFSIPPQSTRLKADRAVVRRRPGASSFRRASRMRQKFNRSAWQDVRFYFLLAAVSTVEWYCLGIFVQAFS